MPASRCTHSGQSHKARMPSTAHPEPPSLSSCSHSKEKNLVFVLFCGWGAFLSYVEVKAQRPSRNSMSPGLGKQLSSQTCWEDSAGPSSPVALPCTGHHHFCCSHLTPLQPQQVRTSRPRADARVKHTASHLSQTQGPSVCWPHFCRNTAHRVIACYANFPSAL